MLQYTFQVLAALRFYASGSYQLSVGQNFLFGLSQPSVSRSVTQVSNLINELLMGQHIRFPVEERDLAASKQK